MIRNFFHIGINSLKRNNFVVMAEKVYLRLVERKHGILQKEVIAWCEAQAKPFEEFLKNLDADLWAETQSVAALQEKEAQEKLASLGKDLGGGGHYYLLYFLVRYLQPKTVVETGVASGWSSQALLSALTRNQGEGRLYSSDFPYFRYPKPERYIGYLVDEALKGRWSLYIDGDRKNLKEIVKVCGDIDLFHYDSDKSYRGRDYALKTLAPRMSSSSVIIFDDIQDNFHFRDYVEKQKARYKIFSFQGKYVGLIDNSGRLL